LSERRSLAGMLSMASRSGPLSSRFLGVRMRLQSLAKVHKKSLNKQLVDRCDMCLALFANRLGTPTASAESGTAEEIARLSESGRYVAILRSRRTIDASRLDYSQALSLQKYLDKLSANALILEYASDDELTQRVDTILAAAVSRDQQLADPRLTKDIRKYRAEVWPRIDSCKGTRRDRHGEMVEATVWQLVLTNTSDAPAREVRARIQSEARMGGADLGNLPQSEN
jgi:hypothetical protein